MNKQQNRQCSYCGLSFGGSGYSPDGKRYYCCYGCFLVEKILGAGSNDGIASWIAVRMGVGAFLSMNVMMLSMILYFTSAHDLGASAVNSIKWAMLIVSTPAMIILGIPFARCGAVELLRRHLSTDILILTGSMSAYIVSTWHVISGSGQVYFDTATMLLLIVTIGRLLEAVAKSRTSQAIREIIELSPRTARVLRGGAEVEISTEDVCIGDLMIVKPGERIAADGRIVSGECMVEESAFTGESCPRSCGTGNVVFGGSVNCDGYIRLEVTAAGSDSLLSQIQEMVRRTQQERAPVERLVERVSSVFVPAIWVIALATAAYWGIFQHDLARGGMSVLAVLVVACPCALGLATPMATCFAIGKAARAGVLISSGEILERLPSVKRIFFDKTGTLTENHLSVVKVYDAAGSCISESDTFAWAAPIEVASGHAIGRAVADYAQGIGVETGELLNFKVIPGHGVQGDVRRNGEIRRVTVGSLKLLAEEHQVADKFYEIDASGEFITTYIGWSGEVQAGILLADSACAGAKETIRLLKDMGVSAAVISGDREPPTRRLANTLGICEIFSCCTPSEKIEIIKNFGGGSAMVGDGINDAPALAQADVGIAIGSETDLARQSSDISLLGSDLTRIPWMLELSGTTYKIIRQNLYWAFGYNSIAVILASLGHVHPLIAATAMFASSLTVIANSMRIR